MTETGTWEKTRLGIIHGREVYLVRLENLIDLYAIDVNGTLRFLFKATGDLIEDLNKLVKEYENENI